MEKSLQVRTTTLSPVISKLFEMVMLAVLEKQLDSDRLQFGLGWKSKLAAVEHCLL